MALKIILASGSPRRSEILRKARLDFEICAADVDESVIAGEPPAEYVLRLARTKAQAIHSDEPSLVIGADTTVVVDDLILAKPEDAEDARRMLRLLSGREHQVLTGVAVHHTGLNQTESDIELTRVWFDELTEDWISWYIASGEPFDKAGAYAIQGLSAPFIDRIEGNYLNIVGLPAPLVRRLMRKFGED